MFWTEKTAGDEVIHQTLKVVGRIIETLMRQKVDINGTQFGFISGCGTTYSTFMYL